MILQKEGKHALSLPLKIVAVYICWKGFHYLAHVPGTWLAVKWQKICLVTGSFYAVLTAWLLRSTNTLAAFADGININLTEYNKQIWVQEHCLAIPAMVVFTGTVLLVKSPPAQKLWFIPLGLGGIVLINTLRLVFVSLAWVHLSGHFFNLHHSFIYTVVTYSFIFFMLAWWINRNTAVAPATQQHLT